MTAGIGETSSTPQLQARHSGAPLIQRRPDQPIDPKPEQGRAVGEAPSRDRSQSLSIKLASIGLKHQPEIPINFNFNSPDELQGLLANLKQQQVQGTRIAFFVGAGIGGTANAAMLAKTRDFHGNEWITGIFEKRTGFSVPNVGTLRKDATAGTLATSEELLNDLFGNLQITPIATQMVQGLVQETRTADEVIAASRNFDYTDLGTISPSTVVSMQMQALASGQSEYCFRQDNVHLVHAEVSDIQKAFDGVNYVPTFQMDDGHGSTVTIRPRFVPDLVGLADGASSQNADRVHPVTRIPTPERLYVTNFKSDPCEAPTGFFMRLPGSGEVKIALGASGGDHHILSVALHMNQSHIDDINREAGLPPGDGLAPEALQAKIHELRPLLDQAGFKGSLDLQDATYHTGLLKTVVTVATNPIDGNLVYLADAGLGGSAVGGLGATVSKSKSLTLLQRHVTDPRFGVPEKRAELEADFRKEFAQVAEARHESMGAVMRKMGFYDRSYEVARAQAMKELLRSEPAQPSVETGKPSDSTH